jgi:hypothetical protein
MDGKIHFGPDGPAASSRSTELSEQEKEMLRNEFRVMQKCDFVFLDEIGAGDADEYILRITELRLTREEC